MKKAYTLGYYGRKPEDLLALAERVNGVIIDARFSPFSRWAKHWNKGNLQKVLGNLYWHVKDWGNVAYRSKDTIVLRDFQGGLDAVEAISRQLDGRTPIIMCACKDYHTCHRSEIARRLREAGWEVDELDNFQVSPRGLLKQGGLFDEQQ